MVNNSLTGTLEPFRPANGNQVLWYTCGPTVYDACHMGHARAYLTLDILRRIMEDWFGYDILYHVNITDVDDKIILRARQEFLLKEWMSATFGGVEEGGADTAQATATLTFVLCEVGEALGKKSAKLAKGRAKLEEPLPVGAGTREREDQEAALKGQALKEEQLTTLQEAHTKAAAAAAAAAAGASSSKLLSIAREVASLCGGEVGELVDARKGAQVSDHGVFNAHSRKFEKAFLDDMEALGVRPPDVLTRVTEYVPQIAAFVKAIQDKGLAYASNGSVYLSIDAFKKAGHTYRKLKPFSGDTSEADMAEGEGSLGSEATDKKHKNDFALWKASKDGEPWWESPWGKGRPGWHIECSVIASDVLGPNLDVHAGGVDLKFPHHDNELAQAEAFFGHSQWVNYFFHAGHLDIKGLKMSKSLKNFITIRQALEKHSARQIRIMFLLQPWDKGMNYSDQTVADAKAKEALFRNFFGSVKAVSAATDAATGMPAWLLSEVGWRNRGEDTAAAAAGTAPEAAFMTDKGLALSVLECSKTVHEAMCRNFDTPAVLASLVKLVKFVNVYLSPANSPHTAAKPAVPLLRKAAAQVTKVLRVLGVVEGADDLGFPLTGLGGGASGGGEGGGGQEELLAPFLDAFRDFRHEVRSLMRGAQQGAAASAKNKNKEGGGEGGGGEEQALVATGLALAACDTVRDHVLPRLGVKLEDVSAGVGAGPGDGGSGGAAASSAASSRWKLDDPAVLVREIEEKLEKEAAARAEKAAKQLSAAKKKLGDATDASADPKTLFSGGARAKEFSAFGEADGVPTHAAVVKGEGGGGSSADTAGASSLLGEPLSKSALKSLAKEKANHEKKHTKLRADATKAGVSVEEHIARLAAEVEKLEV